MDKNKETLPIFVSRSKEQLKTINGETQSSVRNSRFAVFRKRDF